MAIIDVHSEIGSTPLWGVAYTEKHLLAKMQQYGVEYSLVSSTVGNSCDFVRGNMQLNRLIAGQKSLRGCYIVNPNYTEQSQKEFRTYMTADNAAAIVLTSGRKDIYVTIAEVEELLNAYRRFLKPVFLYVPNKAAALAANDIAKAFPNMKFILLSMGGDDWRIPIVLAERTLNLIPEISGSFSPDKVKFAVDRIGSHRIVYGSGLPYVDPSSIIALVEDADISEADKRNIFAGTARRLFKLSPPINININD